MAASTTKKVFKIIGNILLWVFIVLAALMTVVAFTSQGTDGVPNVLGKIPSTILTPSMEPTIKTGELIISDTLTREQKATLSVGDVITFKTDLDGDNVLELNTHRIVSVRSADGVVYYTTKGDNNAVNDTKEVMYGDVVGKWSGTKVPVIGNVLKFLQEPTSFLLCIVLPLCLFFLFELYRFIAIAVSLKTKKTADIDEEAIKKQAIAEYLASQQKTGDGNTAETDEQTAHTDK